MYYYSYIGMYLTFVCLIIKAQYLSSKHIHIQARELKKNKTTKQQHQLLLIKDRENRLLDHYEFWF